MNAKTVKCKHKLLEIRLVHVYYKKSIDQLYNTR